MATFIDVVLPLVVFGLGISLLVAPLTTALMSSIPVNNAGLGSAINNAVSRAASPLVSALLFIAITATFYPALAGLVPSADVNDPALREQVQPLTSVPDDVDPEIDFSVGAVHFHRIRTSTDDLRLVVEDTGQPVMIVTTEPVGPKRVRLLLPPPQPSDVQILGKGADAAPAVVDLLERLGVLAR